jgi:hypothetical protein
MEQPHDLGKLMGVFDEIGVKYKAVKDYHGEWIMLHIDNQWSTHYNKANQTFSFDRNGKLTNYNII